MQVTHVCRTIFLALVLAPGAGEARDTSQRLDDTASALELPLTMALGATDPALTGQHGIGETLRTINRHGVPCAAGSLCDQTWTENPFPAAPDAPGEERFARPRTSVAIGFIGTVLVISLLPLGRQRRGKFL